MLQNCIFPSKNILSTILNEYLSEFVLDLSFSLKMRGEKAEPND